jgi:hypothetical protein
LRGTKWGTGAGFALAQSSAAKNLSATSLLRRLPCDRLRNSRSGCRHDARPEWGWRSAGHSLDSSHASREAGWGVGLRTGLRIPCARLHLQNCYAGIYTPGRLRASMLTSVELNGSGMAAAAPGNYTGKNRRPQPGCKPYRFANRDARPSLLACRRGSGRGPEAAPGAQASWAAEARKRRCRLPAHTRAATPIRRARTPRTRTPHSYRHRTQVVLLSPVCSRRRSNSLSLGRVTASSRIFSGLAVPPGDLAAALPLRVDPVSLLLSLVAVTADGGNIHKNKLTGRSQLRQHQADAADDGVLRAAARAERQQLDGKSGGERTQNQHARVQIHIAQD